MKAIWLRAKVLGFPGRLAPRSKTARQIFALRDEHRNAIKKTMGAGTGLHLLDYLYEKPMINIRMVERRLKISFVTANKLVEHSRD
jgi:hypothetical protein